GASIAANPSGHTSPPGDRVTGGNWLLPTNRLGLGRLRRFGPSPAARATFRYASLRARRGVHSKNRVRKVQGDSRHSTLNIDALDMPSAKAGALRPLTR